MLSLLLCLAACEQSGSELGNTLSETLAEAKVDPANAPIGALSDAAYPLAYQLDLKIDPRQDSFSGEAIIDIELQRPTNGVWLHGQSLNVSSVSLDTSVNEQVQVSYQEVLPSGVAWVGFGQEVAAGDIRLHFNYSADFDQNLAGLFKVDEQGDAYALAKSESIQARKYLPGFDQPGFKAPFTISLTIPKGFHAIGNAPEVSHESVGADYDRVQFATTPPMSTYLLSLAVGPFDVVERDAIPPSEFRDRAIPLRGVARRGRGAELDYVLDITPRYIEIFEQALGRPYPFQKLDIVAAPEWPSGATELSGAITYREERLFLDDNPSPGARLALLGIHAHEIAHMWFGNQVTPPWWDDLWLKEGFATWATPMVLSLFEPDGQHDLNGLQRNFGVMGDDSLAAARAIREPIDRNEDIRNAYDGITYSKSQAIIHMVDSYFGADKFRRALGGYLQAYVDSVANSEDFYTAIGEQTGEPELTRVFRNFVEQSGVPSLAVVMNCPSDVSGDASGDGSGDNSGSVKVTFNQTRYKPLGSAIAAENYWAIPVCLRYPNDDGTAVQCSIITQTEPDMVLNTSQCPDWLMPNANGSGYYRWQLAHDDWPALLNQFDQLAAGEQMALVDSVIAAFESGALDMVFLLNTVELSSKASTRHVVEAPLQALTRYLDIVFEAEQASDFKQQVAPWYIAALQQVENPASEAEGLLKNRLSGFLALTLDHQPTRQLLAEQAAEFTGFKRARDSKALESDLFEIALTVAVEDYGSAFYQHLLNNVADIDDPRFSGAIPSALGAVKDSGLLSQARAYALSEEIGPRESFSMIMAMFSNLELREQNWLWYKANLPTILNKIPSQWQRRTPRVASVFCERDKIAELEQLFAQHGESAPGHELALRQTSEAIVLCAALRTYVGN